MNTRPTTAVLLLSTLFICTAATLPGHESWIMPAGQKGLLEIGHGHSFPVSKQAMNQERLQVFVAGEDGTLQPAVIKREQHRLTAQTPSTVTLLHLALFTEDPLIYNRTSQGVKTGPMTQFPGVADSFRRHRSGVYQAQPGVNPPRLNGQLLLFLIKAEQQAVLQAYLGDVPLGDVEISCQRPREEALTKLGKTDRQGRLSVSAEQPGLYLFTAHYSQPSHDPQTRRDDYSATLVVHIR